MSSYKSILAVVRDGNEASPALWRAGSLARASGAKLHVVMLSAKPAVNAVGRISETAADIARSGILASRRDWLAEYCITLSESGIPASCEVLWQEQDEDAVLNQALDMRPDLVVKDAERAKGIRVPFLSTLDQALLCSCPYPLMLVRADANPLPERIVAAVDPMLDHHTERRLNERVVKAAQELALQADASLRVLTVVQKPIPGKNEDAQDLQEQYANHRKLHHDRFRKFSAELGLPETATAILHGPVARELEEYAGIVPGTLLVIGTLYRQGLESMFLGSVAKTLATESHADILAIKPEGFDEDFMAVHGIHALKEPLPDPNLAVVLGRSVH